MYPNIRALLPGLLFATVLLGGLTLASAPETRYSRAPASSDKARVDQEERSKAESATDQEEQNRVDREMNREMMRMREAVVREALARMRAGGTFPTRQIIGDIGAFLIFLTIVGSLLWILRVILDNRRWNKIAKVQTEMHAKLLEKFASSQELLAYMESGAGKRFLESVPLTLESRPRSTPFPFGRILWSVQVGVILALIGAGLLFLRDRVPEAMQPLLVFGTLISTLGAGFILSAGVSYALAKSFGLLEGASPSIRESTSTPSRDRLP